MRDHLARYRIPERVMSDNRQPFNSEEFASFVSIYGFKHVTSSPGYSQRNGKAVSECSESGKNSHEDSNRK